MIARNKFAALGAAILLTASIGLSQTKTAPAKVPAAAKAPTAATHVMNGTIQSVTGSGDAMTVVIQGEKKTDKPVTLMLNNTTTRTGTGELAQGTKVTAHYRVDSGQNIATSITMTAAKPAATAKTTSAKAPPSTNTSSVKK